MRDKLVTIPVGGLREGPLKAAGDPGHSVEEEERTVPCLGSLLRWPLTGTVAKRGRYRPGDRPQEGPPCCTETPRATRAGLRGRGSRRRPRRTGECGD